MKELIITWQGLLFEAASFLIFSYLLNIFLIKPIKEIISKRAEILHSHEKKEKDYYKSTEDVNSNMELQRTDLKYEINELKSKNYTGARTEANRILSSARESGEKKFRSIIDDFNKEKESVMSYLEKETKELSEKIFEKIMD